MRTVITVRPYRPHRPSTWGSIIRRAKPGRPGALDHAPVELLFPYQLSLAIDEQPNSAKGAAYINVSSIDAEIT